MSQASKMRVVPTLREGLWQQLTSQCTRPIPETVLGALVEVRSGPEEWQDAIVLAQRLTEGNPTLSVIIGGNFLAEHYYVGDWVPNFFNFEYHLRPTKDSPLAYTNFMTANGSYFAVAGSACELESLRSFYDVVIWRECDTHINTITIDGESVPYPTFEVELERYDTQTSLKPLSVNNMVRAGQVLSPLLSREGTGPVPSTFELSPNRSRKITEAERSAMKLLLREIPPAWHFENAKNRRNRMLGALGFVRTCFTGDAALEIFTSIFDAEAINRIPELVRACNELEKES